MAKRKGQFSARISELLRQLIDLEIKEGGGTQGAAMERLAIRAASTSPEAAKLVLEHAEKDSRTREIMALAYGQKARLSDGSGDRKRK